MQRQLKNVQSNIKKVQKYLFLFIFNHLLDPYFGSAYLIRTLTEGVCIQKAFLDPYDRFSTIPQVNLAHPQETD